MINKILKLIGYRQVWHMCWVARMEDESFSIGEGSFILRPRMTVEDIHSLKEKFKLITAESAGKKVAHVTIISMVRISK